MTDIETKSELAISLPSEISATQVVNLDIKSEQNEPKMNHIPTEVLSIFPNLKYFFIYNSEIEDVSRNDLLNGTNLTHFGLFAGKLDRLPPEILQVKKFIGLALDDNQIETIDDFAFANQIELNELMLKSNKLSVIKRNTFAGLFNLTELFLHYNEIHTIEDGAFADLSKLGRLRLNNNKIKAFGDHVFDGLTSLTVLQAWENKIENIGNSLNGLTSIARINLRSNRINDIDLVKFAKLPELTDLVLGATGVGLKNIDVEFGSSFKSPLKYLDISHNNLTNIEDLKVLRISPN